MSLQQLKDFNSIFSISFGSYSGDFFVGEGLLELFNILFNDSIFFIPDKILFLCLFPSFFQIIFQKEIIQKLQQIPSQMSQKPSVREVINLEEITTQKSNYEQDAFVSDIATHCGNFLTWVTNKNSHLFAESMWKNEMRKKASEMYPELDIDEIKRLVDRDWRIMSQENKQKIALKYNEPQNSQQITTKLSKLRDTLHKLKN